MTIMASGAALLSLTAALAGSALALGAPALAEPLPYGPDTCIQGFVWREARGGDTVCVTPPTRDATAQQNANAAQNREPNGGAFGPATCKPGFVWREAFDGDVVCVTPAVRSQAAGDNAAAGSRYQRNQPVPTPVAQPPQPEPQTPYEGPSGYDLDGRKPCGTGLPGDRNFDRDFCEILEDQPS